MADAFPIVSQTMSLVQWISGDSEGAKRTQEIFSRQCPIISQARSAVEAISGDPDAALATQMECLNFASNFVDAVPVVGHIKGGCHYAWGDTEGGDNAMKVSKVAKIRNRYNQVPHLTQDTNGKVTNSQKTPQTRAKRSALSQQVTTKHI